jgi:hypothetical protein
MSYQVEGRELMRPEDVGRIEFNEELLFIYGEQPIYGHKFDLVTHQNYKYTFDYANSIGCSECCHLDRSGMTPPDSGRLTLSAVPSKATPTVEAFTMDAFQRIQMKFTSEEAVEELQNNFQDMYDDSEAFA